MTNLKQMRESTGLSQSQFAKKADVNMRVFQNYEQGLRSIDGAKIETLLKISNAANCRISDIIENTVLQEELRKSGY